MIPLLKKNFWLIALICVCACNKAPIPVKPMAQILADMAAADGYAKGLNRINDSTYNSVEINTDTLRYFYQSILAHYNIDAATFKKAQKWYIAHPNMYDSVLLMSIQIQNDLQKGAHVPPKIATPNIKLNKGDSSEQMLNNNRKIKPIPNKRSINEPKP